MVPQKWVERMHYLLPDSKLVVIEKNAHVVNFSAPQQVTNEVVTFIKQKS